MKKIFLIAPLFTSIVFAQTKKIVKPVKKSIPEKTMALTSIDSLSYAMGIQTAQYYKSQGIEKINGAMVKKAYEDVFNNKTTLLSPETSNMTIQKKMQDYMMGKSNTEKEASAKFLEENKKKPGITTLPDGLQYEILTKGTGAIPKATDTVKAHYIGTLADGKEFDNSYKRGEPLTIPVGGVIKGWTEALQMMPVGSKWKLYIPSDLGYGDRGAGGAIPGGAALVFTVELIDIVNKQ